MSVNEFDHTQQDPSRAERAYRRAKSATGTAGLLAIACAAHMVGVDPGLIHDVTRGLSQDPMMAHERVQDVPQIATSSDVPDKSHSRAKQAMNTLGMTVYGLYYFGEDGMALGVNAAAVGLMERTLDGGNARLAAAGLTAAAVTGWNDVALHWNERMLRRAMNYVEPSAFIESDRPIVQQLGLIKSNIREIFVNEEPQESKEDDKKQSKLKAKAGRIKKWMGDHASILNTSIVGAPVGFNDELMRKKLDVRTLKRRKIEAIIAKHSATFGATWGALAATRGLDQVNGVLEAVLRPENLAVGLTYVYGNKISRELFVRPTTSVQKQEEKQGSKGPWQFEDQVGERLVLEPGGTLHPIHFGDDHRQIPAKTDIY